MFTVPLIVFGVLTAFGLLCMGVGKLLNPGSGNGSFGAGLIFWCGAIVALLSAYFGLTTLTFAIGWWPLGILELALFCAFVWVSWDARQKRG